LPHQLAEAAIPQNLSGKPIQQPVVDGLFFWVRRRQGADLEGERPDFHPLHSYDYLLLDWQP
jgi:hypothetical protein